MKLNLESVAAKMHELWWLSGLEDVLESVTEDDVKEVSIAGAENIAFQENCWICGIFGHNKANCLLRNIQ